MKTIEHELRQTNENLYELYNRSYNLAVEHWLPQVKPSNDSYNSLPHLLGVKKRIERILYPEDRNCCVNLSPCELYILLNAILFHDIGKGIDGKVKLLKKDKNPLLYSETKQERFTAPLNVVAPPIKKKKEKPPTCSSVHGYISMRTVKQRWAELGIQSERVAQVIGDVCQYHDALSTEKNLPGSLSIDEYGPVRVSILGALLILGDQLDDTYTRITPRYMKVSGDLSQVGKFRSKIRSTWIDPMRRIACTEIDDIALTLEDLEKPNIAYFIESNAGVNPLRDYIYCKLKGMKYRHGEVAVEDIYQQVKADGKGDYQNISILYSAIGNTCENSFNLNRIRNELYIIEMPIKEWMIEYDGHLFGVNFKLYEYRDQYCLLHDEESNRTIQTKNPKASAQQEEFCYKRYKIFPTGTHFSLEPLIDLAYCNKILSAIYMLAGSILGKPYHDYFDLLNYIRDDKSNLTKVKCAVARLSKLLTLYRGQNNDKAVLYYDDRVWMFSLSSAQNDSCTDQVSPNEADLTARNKTKKEHSKPLSDILAFLKNILQL
jgi:hypothetical protein